MQKMSTHEKIVPLEVLQQRLKELRKQGMKIVFTNGCFDLVHLGHVDYLEKSKAKGDILVVGLNSDASVKRIKGELRPIVDEKSRARLLAALEFVDFVVLFDEDTPASLITALVPDVLIKGNDYEISNIVGADFVLSNGGKVETVELVKGYSSSHIIEKIKTLNQ